MLTLVRDLVAHAEWADAVFFHAWGKSALCDHAELRERVEHIVVVQHAFLSVLRGEPFRAPDEGAPAAYGDLRARAAAGHAGLAAVAAGMDEEGLAETVRIPWFPDPPCILTRAEALVQVAMHTQHHRGQCFTRFRALGGAPKDVDWVIWLWKKKPRGRWE